ncbi:glutathione S-transferase 2 isoform X2 [Arachis ipaensis]|uniref:glutathione S-transferase 2 isoform X2 n=1 Tax=Arachis ipaensis TaxID=130454 RepID=UPI000A2AF7FB|nr:glutathione S-transferase 2 isoform X2 [Arachis ipaensis]XP_025634153.1 glutathione S-transferase 2-like isoform X2 [Arachis hypogaea]XP_025634163.1 glutathione S-transferase 2-like isoform X2 [Arachis hypogaea]
MIVLYSYWLSSCSWRIRFALCLKGIPYEYKAVDLVKGEQFSPEFEKLNPLHCVPVLADDHVVVSDSYAIFLYLEEKYTQKPLLPVDPQIRALNLQIASMINSSIQPYHMISALLLRSYRRMLLENMQQENISTWLMYSWLHRLCKQLIGLIWVNTQIVPERLRDLHFRPRMIFLIKLVPER